MTIYKKTETLIKREIEKEQYESGKTVFYVYFIYDVETILFGKTHVSKKRVKDNCVFYSEAAADEYIKNVEKESAYVPIRIGFDTVYKIKVFPKRLQEYYDAMHYKETLSFYAKVFKYPPVVIYDVVYELIQDDLISKRSVSLAEMMDDLIKSYTKSTSIIKSVNECQHIVIPEVEKIKNESKDVIEKELARVKEYESFLTTLLHE